MYELDPVSRYICVLEINVFQITYEIVIDCCCIFDDFLFIYYYLNNSKLGVHEIFAPFNQFLSVCVCV